MIASIKKEMFLAVIESCSMIVHSQQYRTWSKEMFLAVIESCSMIVHSQQYRTWSKEMPDSPSAHQGSVLLALAERVVAIVQS